MPDRYMSAGMVTDVLPCADLQSRGGTKDTWDRVRAAERDSCETRTREHIRRPEPHAVTKLPARGHRINNKPAAAALLSCW